MRIDSIVINASPLITLFRSDQADLLPRLFTHIVVPEAVWQEVVLGGREDAAACRLARQPWPLRTDVVPSPRVAEWGLGAGETGVLSHALANPGLRAVIDDMDARRCAKTLNIPIFGTGGLLVLAKRRGLLSSVNEGIAKLRGAGLWLSDDVVRLLLMHAGEAGDAIGRHAILDEVPRRPPLPGDE
jgi:predicted nucleic acid-binding protein